MVAFLVDVVHTARDVEERDHLFHVGVDSQRVGFAGWLEHVIARPCDPVMLQVSPGALNHIPMDWRRMAVAAENSRTSNAKKIAPLAVERVQHQRPEPYVRGLRHPDSFVFGNGPGDDLMGRQGMSCFHSGSFQFYAAE